MFAILSVSSCVNPPGLGVIETILLVKLTRFVGDDVNYNICIYIYMMHIYGASDRDSLLKKHRITWDSFFRNDFSLGHHWEPSDGLDRHRSGFITVMALYQL